MNDIYQLPALNRTIDALHLDDDRHAAQITAARLIAEQLDYSDKPTATLCAAYVRLLHDLTMTATTRSTPWANLKSNPT